MKTLILNGSPRINGDTNSLIKYITSKKIDEYEIVNAYRCDISPCLDCRYCWKNNGCSISDEMQDVYKYIQKCDQKDKAYGTACTLLHHMNCHNIHEAVYSHSTNIILDHYSALCDCNLVLNKPSCGI